MTRMSWGTSALVLLAALLVASNLSTSVSADDAIVVYPRLELNTIMTAKRYSRQRDLLIQALSAIMVDLPPDDIYSFYQIGGIHGEPAAPYNNTVNATSPFNFNTTAMVRWLGYCEHSSVLFPTWHRPYVLLLELSITKKAKQIAKTYTKHRSLYMKAAKELRWPFWDWAARSLVYGGKVPPILTQREATVIGPNGKRKTLANPFFAYVYQKDTAPQTPANSPLYNPNYPNYPFTVKKGQSSSRWPDADNVTNNADFIASMSTLNPSYQPPFAGIPESFPKMVMDLFAIRSWPCFSNRQQQLQLQNFGAGTSAFDNTSICIYQAIESVHNWVHLSIGGQARGNRQSGTMSNLQTAGFDPIFFLHHANVDRLFALWQAFRPNEYVEPGVSLYGSYMYDKGMPQNVTSPLWPFVQQSGPSAGKVYTSVDVADVMQLGYTYPDLVGNPSYKQLYANMVEKYGPVQKPFRWFYYVSCSTSWLNATALAVNASFMPTATSPWIPLNTSVVPILMGREGPDRNNELFVASSATEITELMRSYNLTTEVPPVDGNYAKGPSTIPLFVKNFESNCINGTSAIPEPHCTCIQKVIWAVNAPIDHPYASYSGFTDVPDTCIDCP